jgi:hypothetical protein
MLRFWYKKERPYGSIQVEVQIPGVSGHPNNLVKARRAGFRASEMLSDGIFIFEKLPSERLIDHGNMP